MKPPSKGLARVVVYDARGRAMILALVPALVREGNPFLPGCVVAFYS